MSRKPDILGASSIVSSSKIHRHNLANFSDHVETKLDRSNSTFFEFDVWQNHSIPMIIKRYPRSAFAVHSDFNFLSERLILHHQCASFGEVHRLNKKNLLDPIAVPTTLSARFEKKQKRRHVLRQLFSIMVIVSSSCVKMSYHSLPRAGDSRQ
jgi:hypothetical protein